MEEVFLPKGTGGFISPEKVIAQLELKPGWQVADFGCGHGYFTLPVAKFIGPEGKVFAVDVLLEALEAVRSRAQLENVVNVETVRGNLELASGSGLPDNSVDLVLLHNVLFQSQKKSDIIKEARRVLKNGGLFALVDWRPASTAGGAGQAVFGPQEGSRLAPEQAQELAQNEAFAFRRSFDAGQYHFGLMFLKA